MPKVRITAVFSTFLVLTLATSLAFPAAAFAAQPNVRVTECNASPNASTSVSSITIGDVNAPEPGSVLDETAVVSTAEGPKWEIPVLWIDSSLQLASIAAEGQQYLPALAFYMPAEYTVGDANDAGAFTIALTPQLASLFGDEDVVSVYVASTGITYILPASLSDFFAPAANASGQQATSEQVTAEQITAEQAAPEQTSSEHPIVVEDSVDLIDLYCSESAKEALSEEDLEYLIDLILNKLEPQAVNLLREKFPAFDEAIANGEIGTRIGLYVYYKTGDQDGIEEHENAQSDSLAYVLGRPKIVDGGTTFVYLLAVNAAGVSETDASGRVTIARTGTKASDLQNTLVHEMFHAYMDDYNRAGMIGAINDETVVQDLANLTGEEQARFPEHPLPSMVH